MKRMMAAAIIATVFFMACPAYCSIYYVATTGNDTTGDGTIGNPYLTIGKAVGLVVAGDTIYVRAGTYSYTGSSTAITLPSKTGSSETNRCSLMGYNGERPLLDFSAMTGTGADGLKINGSYWYLKGIDLKGAPHNGIKISGGSYNIIEFCSSYENRNSGVQLGGGAAYNQIINCDSYYNRDAGDGNADGFSPKLDVGTGNYFYGCRSWQNSDDAYDGYLRGADDVTTTYENCWAIKAGYLKDGSAGTGNGNGFKMGGCDLDPNGQKLLRHNAILRNCLAFNNLAKGFDQNSDKGSMTLYNCTAFGNGGNNYSITTAPLGSGKTATVTNSVNFTGTVSLGSFVAQITDSWQSPFVVTSADFVSVDPAAAYGPRQADGSLPDITFMHLAAGSDLIDGGTDVGLPYNGTKPDLGCFEYAVTNDTTAPTPNPMTFATVPYAASATSVAMVATTASDISGVEYYFACTAGGGHDSAWQNGTSYTDTGLTGGVTYTYRVIARDKSANHNETGWSAETSATPQVDNTAPAPNPMTFATLPYAASPTSVAMVATAATDASGVEYYFACTAGGGHDSAWQNGTSYTDTGLTGGVTYTYRVIARDKSANHNETGWSAEASATPQADNTAPVPNPMTWQTAPYATSTSSVGMTATTATDASGGVQYFFANVSVGGHDSGWQTGTTFTDTGLAPGATYVYQVKARDGSPALNETAWSTQASVTLPTLPPLNPPSAYWMFDETSGTTAYDSVGSNNGTLQGAPAPSWTAGKYSNCLSFINTTQSVRVPHHTSIDFASESFTVSLWAKQPVSYSGQYELFIKGTIGSGAFPGSGKRYELYRKDSSFRFAIDDNATKTEISVATTSICTGNWVYITAVRDIAADQIRLYVNGSLVSAITDNTGSINQSEPLYVGYAMSPGAVDDLRIYRYALTQDQITAVYGGAGLPDNVAPTPNPMTWVTEPNAIGIDTITMTATAATDASGVEYYFANITDPNHNSAWQDSSTYTDIGLVNNTQYTYTVIARDKSIGHNETGWSSQLSATTLRYVCTSPIASDLNGDCQADFLDFALMGNTWAGDTAAWTSLTQFAADWLICNRDPAGECWQ